MFNATARWLVTFISLSLLLTWCFLNRGKVVFDISPVHDSLSVPLFAVILGVSILGFLWGAAIVWLSSAPVRAERRQLKRDLRDALHRLHDQAASPIMNHPDVVIDGLLPARRKKWWGATK